MPRLDHVVSSGLQLKRMAAREQILSGELQITITSPGRPAVSVQSPSWMCLATDLIEVSRDGGDAQVVARGHHRLVFMNKPPGVLSERRKGRSNVYELIPPEIAHKDLGAFGRLDRDTTGLLVFGTDGGLCHLATDPRIHLPKVYTASCTINLCEARVATHAVPNLVADDGAYHYDVAAAAFAEGLTLTDGTVCKPAVLEWDLASGNPVAKVTLSEGKYHQVKRMLGAIGAKVLQLHRNSIGTLSLDTLGLAVGEARAATQEETLEFCGMFPATGYIRDNPDRAG